MAALHLVLDRTKPEAATVDVFQASKLVMSVVARRTELPSSPGLLWMVSFRIRDATISSLAAAPFDAFLKAVDRLRTSRGKVRLPDFTPDELASLTIGLYNLGVFGPI